MILPATAAMTDNKTLDKVDGQGITIPSRMRHLPLWKGYLVHHTVFVGPDGVPDFKVIHENSAKCAEENRCHLCGQKLDLGVVFIGGTKSIAAGQFVDGPMHEECAMYAAKACPFLNDANYGQTGHISPRHEKQGTQLAVLEIVATGRPARMALYYTSGYKVVREGGGQYFVAKKPFHLDWVSMPSRPEAKAGDSSS